MIPLLEVVCNVGAVAFSQIAAIVLKVGLITFILIVNVAVVAH